MAEKKVASVADLAATALTTKKSTRTKEGERRQQERKEHWEKLRKQSIIVQRKAEQQKSERAYSHARMALLVHETVRGRIRARGYSSPAELEVRKDDVGKVFQAAFPLRVQRPPLEFYFPAAKVFEGWKRNLNLTEDLGARMRRGIELIEGAGGQRTGSAPGQFNGPIGVIAANYAIVNRLLKGTARWKGGKDAPQDIKTTIFVADTANNRVQMLLTNITEHREANAVNDMIVGAPVEPTRVLETRVLGHWFDPEDRHPPRFRKPPPGSSTRASSSRSGTKPSFSRGNCTRPLGIAIGADGFVFVTENDENGFGSPKIQIFNFDGNLVRYVDNSIQPRGRQHLTYSDPVGSTRGSDGRLVLKNRHELKHIFLDCNGRPMLDRRLGDYVPVQAILPVGLADLISANPDGGLRITPWADFAKTFAANMGSAIPHWYKMLRMRVNARVGAWDWHDLCRKLDLTIQRPPAWYVTACKIYDAKSTDRALGRGGVLLHHLLEASGLTNADETVGHVWVEGTAVNIVTGMDSESRQKGSVYDTGKAKEAVDEDAPAEVKSADKISEDDGQETLGQQASGGLVEVGSGPGPSDSVGHAKTKFGVRGEVMLTSGSGSPPTYRRDPRGDAVEYLFVYKTGNSEAPSSIRKISRSQIKPQPMQVRVYPRDPDLGENPMERDYLPSRCTEDTIHGGERGHPQECSEGGAKDADAHFKSARKISASFRRPGTAETWIPCSVVAIERETGLYEIEVDENSEEGIIEFIRVVASDAGRTLGETLSEPRKLYGRQIRVDARSGGSPKPVGVSHVLRGDLRASEPRAPTFHPTWPDGRQPLRWQPQYKHMFRRPWGIDVYPKRTLASRETRTIVVADNLHHCVHVLKNITNGTLDPDNAFAVPAGYDHTFGSRGSKRGELNGPRGLCVDSDARVVVADSQNNRIQGFRFFPGRQRALGGAVDHWSSPVGMGGVHVGTEKDKEDWQRLLKQEERDIWRYGSLENHWLVDFVYPDTQPYVDAVAGAKYREELEARTLKVLRGGPIESVYARTATTRRDVPPLPAAPALAARYTDTQQTRKLPLKEPSDVAVDVYDNYIVADTGNHCIRILARVAVEPHEYPDRFGYEIPRSERWMYVPADVYGAMGPEKLMATVPQSGGKRQHKARMKLAADVESLKEFGHPSCRQRRGTAVPGHIFGRQAGRAGDSSIAVERTNRHFRDGQRFVRVVPGVRLQLLATFGGIGEFPLQSPAPGWFWRPMGVSCYSLDQKVMPGDTGTAVVSLGEHHIVVADTGNNRIQVLRYIVPEMACSHDKNIIIENLDWDTPSKAPSAHHAKQWQCFGWTREYHEAALRYGLPIEKVPVDPKKAKSEDESSETEDEAGDAPSAESDDSRWKEQ